MSYLCTFCIDLWIDNVYILLMANIQYYNWAVENYRNEKNKMSRDELANCTGLSARSIIRIESDEIELSEDDNRHGVNIIQDRRLSKLAHCLGIPQHKLWAQIPEKYDFYGNKIHSSAQLADVVLNSDKLNHAFRAQSIPEDEYLRDLLIKIAEMCDELKNPNRAVGIKNSSVEQLRRQIIIEDAYNELINHHVGSFYIIEVSRFDAAIFDEMIHHDPEWLLGPRCWNTRVQLVFTLSDDENGIPFLNYEPIMDSRDEDERRKFSLKLQTNILEYGRNSEITPF